MMQIDDQYKELSSDELGYIWHWKKNIDRGYKVLEDKRKETVGELESQTKVIKKVFKESPDNVTPADDQVEGNNTFIHTPSNFGGFAGINSYFGNRATDATYKSFIEANIIRRYNGGKYYFAFKNSDNQTSYWEIVNTRGFANKSYVELICNENE